LEALGVRLLGVSFDAPEDNRAFAEKEGYAGTLLSDVERNAAAAYQARRARDDAYPDFARRITYLIDPEGVIRRAYRVTDIPAHADEVLRDLRELLGS
jgi:peroxiredoxin Q/BCP